MSKGPPHDGVLAGLAIAGLYTGRGGSVRTKVCQACRKPIVGGQGYRWVDGIGHVHGACAAEREAEREGKDARQGQADGSGDRGGVCPEG